MSSSIKEFEHLKISLEDIKSATNDFTDCIGQGGFGKVYKGKLVLSSGLTLVAVKRLNKELGQGAPEFWREIMLLTRYKHENLVSLLGFCDEGREMILVYEYLPNKSLDLYLTSTNLSWNQRLRICLGAAHGLQYLHEPFEGSQQRVLHRDIKSANILLDQNWKPKISDFGLSKFGPANQQFTFLYSNAVGTFGYCDPLYGQKGFLTKESDIYSFGAVLFEVLCGRHCVQIINKDTCSLLPELARKCYEEKILDTIVDKSLKEQISPDCLERFSKIAYQCLRIAHTQRPLVTEIVKELEIALEYQEEYEFAKQKKLNSHVVSESDSDEYWETKLPRDWEVIARIFNISPTIYTIKKELFSHLHKGILFDEGNKFFWINNDGKKCVLISASRFLKLDHTHDGWVFQRDYLRFSKVADIPCRDGEWHDIRFHIKAGMLSLGTMYAASLVFKFNNEPNTVLKHVELIKIKWKMEELSVSSLHHAELTPDRWYKITMWRFINHGPNADFDIVLEQLSHPQDYFKSYLDRYSGIMIQGIEFQPTEMQEDIKGFESLSITNEEDIDDDEEDVDDEYWEKKLPDDYTHYIKMSDKPLKDITIKELYHCFCEGFLGYKGNLWFSLHKSTRGICSMRPATDILFDNPSKFPPETLYLSESRFGKVTKLGESERFSIKCRLWPNMFSSPYFYECYLVFKFEDNHDQLHDPSLFKSEYSVVDVRDFKGPSYTVYACLNMYTVKIPTIKPTNDYIWHDSSSTGHRMPIGHMENLGDINCIKERKDGWLEVKFCKPNKLHYYKSLDVEFSKEDGLFPGMIIEGIEFRPYIRFERSIN